MGAQMLLTVANLRALGAQEFLIAVFHLNMILQNLKKQKIKFHSNEMLLIVQPSSSVPRPLFHKCSRRSHCLWVLVSVCSSDDRHSLHCHRMSPSRDHK